MKLVNDVFEIAESFMEEPKYVTINKKEIKFVAKDMLEIGKPRYASKEIKNPLKEIIIELVGCSVNYCYWYGKHNIRPCGASSTFMGEILVNSFFDFEYASDKKFNECLDVFGKNLSINRFPLISERIGHLNELRNGAIDFCIDILNTYQYKINNNNVDYFLTIMVDTFPGFSSDIFLKRASLFFIQLYRRFGWLKDELHFLHVPADYQIPKMLEHHNCIIYSPDLKKTINDNQLIPKNSLQECEIRAATILAIRELCKETGWNVADVDSYFFFNRHSARNPFHLTITTDY